MKTQQIWHTIGEDEVLEKIGSSLQGLTDTEAKKRLRIHGPNIPVRQKPKSIWWVFLAQFQSPLVYLLIISSIVTAVLGRMVDTWVILIIVIVNAVVGFLQELKAEKSLEALKKIVTLRTKVIREGEEEEISAYELTIGDIVVLDNGVKIPTDLRLLKCDDLKIDESSLTGESVPVHKNLRCVVYKTPVADRKNMAYAGTIVTNGRGLGVVVAISTKTQIGQIAKEVAETHEEKTPLHKNLEVFSRYLLYFTAGVCSLILVLGIFRGLGIVDMFLTAVAAAVAVIPEGLPVVITITLTVGVYRMARQNALMRKLQAVETLGSITAIASDKTGTLTYNQMTVEKICFPNLEEIKVSGKGYKPEGTVGGRASDSKKLLEVGMLCNNSQLVQKRESWQIQGDPTEGALIVAGAKAKMFKEAMTEKYPRLDEIPFSSELSYMATLHKFGNYNLIAVKGTIEKILSISGYYFFGGKKHKLTKNICEKILRVAHREAKTAHRILALAYSEINRNAQKISGKDINALVYLGFVAMDDPIRKDAIDAISACKMSGIRPIMITGDHPETALAVAKEIGIADQNSQALSENDLEKLSKKHFIEKIRSISVFARIAPKTKLRIVEGLQESNQIVAVTGDGVNDAPVLKRADCGIAMGKSGTDVAREAADMVLLDDNFSTILSAITEGRTIFLNIRRAIFYLLSTNTGEVMILITSLLAGLPLPLIPIQILWINLINDSTGDLALAMEPKHTDVEHYPPRNPKESVINKIVLWRILWVALAMTAGTMLLYYSEISAGASIERARTVAFAVMAVFQIFNIINARSMKTSMFRIHTFNPYFLFSFIGSFILTILTVYLPFFQEIFHIVPLDTIDWIKIICVSLLVFAAVEIDKGIRRIVRSKY